MSCSAPLFLRALDMAQAAPFLQRAWEEIKPEAPQAELMARNLPNGDCEADYLEMRQARRKALFDYLISWSVPNEKTVEDIVFAGDIPTVPSPLEAVYKLSDKRSAKELFEKFSLLTPKWRYLDRSFTRGKLLHRHYCNELEMRIIDGLSFPVAVKPLWDCMGHGIAVLRDAKAYLEYLQCHASENFIIEEYMEGEIGSLEVIGDCGSYSVQPPCRTGITSFDIAGDFDSVRVSHPDLFRSCFNDSLKIKIFNLLSSLKYRGACCFDFIFKSGNIYFLEINPRVSGVSCLCSAASGINTFKMLYAIAKGQFLAPEKEYCASQNAAIQLGGENIKKYEAFIFDNKDITICRDNYITVDGTASRNVIFGGNKNIIGRILQQTGIAIQ